MTDALPDPLVPAEVDLRGYEFMPFYGHHLLGSEFHAQASDAAWRAGITLWWAAWNQVPAASLPNDDTALTRLADLGRDVKGWKKMKADALHGFVLCSDGRLYHRFLAPLAIDAWARRVKEREKKQRWRESRNRSGNGDGTGTGTGTEPGQPPGQNGSGTVATPGTERLKGQGEGKDSERTVNPKSSLAGSTASAPATADAREIAPAVQLSMVLRTRGIEARAMHPTLQEWASAGVTEEQIDAAIAIARERKPEPAKLPIAYLVPIVEQVRNPIDRNTGKPRETLTELLAREEAEANAQH